MTYWIDATTTVNCPPPAVGISRVESNLAEQLIHISRDIRICLYEAQAGRFSELPRDEFLRVMMLRKAPGAAGAPIEFQVQRHDRQSVGGAEIFEGGDVLISCGLNWRAELGNMGRLYQFRKDMGLRLITMCYDLIAINLTHLVPGMEKVFTPYLREMARHADHVLCISRCTRRDLLRWIDASGQRSPETSIMPMGCELPAPGGSVGSRVASILAQRFLLAVSTIENRKNHQTLCRAYARLVDWGVTDLPQLVFVGAMGEGGPRLVDEIGADRRISDKIVVLSGVTDAELVALYEKCLLTLYPSLYEGWGLPVSESLACGKFCVASDQGALREAGEDYAAYLDPWNVEHWASTIHRYLSIPGAVERREFDIRQSYRPKRWRDSAAHVLAIAQRLTQNSV